MYFKLRYRYWQLHLWWLLGMVVSVAITIGLAAGATHLFIITNTTYRDLIVKPLHSTDLQLVAKHDQGMFETWQKVLDDIPELEIITPMLSRQTLAVHKDLKISVQVQGVDIKTLEGLENDPHLVIISKALAKQLDISVGENLELLTPRGFHTFRVISLSNETFPIARASLRDLQKLFTSGNYVDGFDLGLSKTSDQDTMLNMLTEHLQGIATVISTEQRFQPVARILWVLWLVILMLLVCSLVMTIGLLYSFLLASKEARDLEKNLLYIFGVSPKKLRFWQILEINSIMLCAILLGFAGLTLVHTQYPLHQVSFLTAGLSGLMIMALSTYFSFLQQSQADPRSRDYAWLPTKLWLFWRFLAQLGKPYVIAVAILTVALSSLTTAEIVLQNQQQSLKALLKTMTGPSVLTQKDLRIQEEFPLEGKLSQTMRWNMAMLPGVVFVSSHLTKVMLGDTLEETMYVLDFASFPYQSYLQTLQGGDNQDLSLALSAERRLAISESLANSYRLKLGMNLRLQTPTGQHHYKVMAILKDIGNDPEAMFLDKRTYLKDWGRSSEGLFVISLEESSHPQQIASLLQEHLSQRYKGLSWATLSFKSDLEILMSRLLLSCRWLMLVFILMAVLSLSQILSGPKVHQLLSTLYLLGGQRPLLYQLGQNSILFTISIIVFISLALGTGIGYVMVRGLKQASSYWLWGLTGQSYTPTLLVTVALILVLSRAVRSACDSKVLSEVTRTVRFLNTHSIERLF